MIKRLVSLILAAAVVACPAIAQAQTQSGTPSARRDLTNYVLQPSDLIQIRIFQEPDLDRDVRVSQDSKIVLPLVGEVDVRGKTVRALELEVRDLYNRDFLVNPQVNIAVVQYAPRSVNVLGSVNAPGPVSFPPEEPLRLIDAITRAGGFNRLGDASRVQLTRKRDDGSTETFRIDANTLMRGTSTEPWFLERDDVIFVPERIL